MASESIRDSGSWFDLEASGASITNNSFAEANDDTFSLATDGGSRPHLEFEFEWAHGTGPTANAPINFYAKDLTMFGGANHARDPSANNLQRLVKTITVDNTTSTQRRRFDVMFAPADASYWLHNAGTGQTISSGWKLRVRAWTLKPA